MSTKTRALLPLLTLLSAAATAQTAAPAATAPEPPFALTGNINVTTNYKFRGQDQGTTKYVSPAVQGGFDFSSNGFYVGNWNSNVNFAVSIEMDFYAGYKGAITPDLAYDVGILEYYYPEKNKAANFNTTEIYGALTYSFATFKYSHTVSPDYFGFGSSTGKRGRNTGYFDLAANYPLVDKLTLNAHLGYTRFPSKLKDATDLPNYVDYKLGLTYDMSAVTGAGTSVAVAIVGANKKGYFGDINKTRAILTLSKAL